MTILDEVKVLTTTGDEVEVGTVLIESDTTAYKVVLKKIDSAASPANPVISIVDHKITVEVKDTPADAAGITTAIATIKVGGTASAPVYDAAGKDLNCSSGFDTATAPVTCTKVTGLTPDPAPVTTAILAQVQALKDGNSLAIATEKINGVEYTIKVAKLASGGTDGSTIDIGTKTITISKVDWSSSTSDTLKAAIAAVKIGGTPATPIIDPTNGTAITCTADFNSITDIKDSKCTDITLPAPVTTAILAQVQALNVGDAALAIATEKINGVDYTIKAAKLASGGTEGSTIDIGTKTITISKVDWSTATVNSDALKAVINAVKIGGTPAAPIIDATGTASMCYADFTKIADAASANCDSILFASKGYTDVATSILADNKKITSTDNLKTLIKAVLKSDANNDLDAANIVTEIVDSKANDDINNAAKALCPSVPDINKITADDFKTCVANAFKGYATMNKILTNLPYQAKGVLKDNSATKFVDFESGLKDDAFKAGQFYFDFTTTICAARPFISGLEIPSPDVGTCLDQVNTAAYALLEADSKCGSANKDDLIGCYKAIADTGLKALYTATPDALLVDFSANYPDVLDN